MSIRSVSIDRAAELLRCCRRTVYNRIKSGKLQTVRTVSGVGQRVTVESLYALGWRSAPEDDDCREAQDNTPSLGPFS